MDIEKEAKKQKKKREKKMLATFLDNTSVGGKFFKIGTYRITEEQKNIIEDSNFFKKGKILTSNL